MEKTKDPFENIGLSAWDIAKAAGSLSLELFRMHLLSPVSEHFQTPNRGGGPMLDRELNKDQMQLDLEDQSGVSW